MQESVSDERWVVPGGYVKITKVRDAIEMPPPEDTPGMVENRGTDIWQEAERGRETGYLRHAQARHYNHTASRSPAGGTMMSYLTHTSCKRYHSLLHSCKSSANESRN